MPVKPRPATVRDPCGDVRSVANHVEDVPPEELEWRAAAMRQGGRQ